MSENMKLWNSVCETNPDITKRVTQRGGFTAIDSQTQVKRATELWGSYGFNWGLKDVKFNEFREGDKIVGLMAYGLFQYPCNYDDVETGAYNLMSFPIAADMPYKANDDCVKKLQTECISKALSRLGFNSDVFEGKFDDNRYVSEMTKKYAQQKQDLQTDITKAKVVEPFDGAVAMILDMIRDKLEFYLESHCEDGYTGHVDMKLLEEAILGEYGKLPLKESSVLMVANRVWDLCLANDDMSLIFVDANGDVPLDVVKGI